MPGAGEADVRVIAGCLFEIALGELEEAPWRWDGPSTEVTLLGEALRGDEHRFRFRAEAAGAAAGGAELRFCCGEVERVVVVRIAPEADLA